MILVTIKLIKNLSERKSWIGLRNDIRKVFDTSAYWEIIKKNFDSKKLLYRKADTKKDENTEVPFIDVHTIWDSFDSFQKFLSDVGSFWQKLEDAEYELKISIKHLTEKMAEMYMEKIEKEGTFSSISDKFPKI